MILNEQKAIFLHITKTGGTSIERAFGVQTVPNNDQHCKPNNFIDQIGLESWKNHYKFTFVRNPWDRLISWFSFKHLKHRHEFKDFVIKNIDIIVGKPNKHWGFTAQFHWFQGRYKEFDFIGRFENIENDFEHVRKEIGFPETVLRHHNKSEHNHYREYYDSYLRDFVADHFSKDINTFGYEF